jgi:hypothetical protein
MKWEWWNNLNSKQRLFIMILGAILGVVVISILVWSSGEETTGNPTCATFDCTGQANNLSSSPGDITCPADPCIPANCCNGTPTVVTPPDGNPTCATFDCTGQANNLSSSPGDITCPADPCIPANCCNGTPTVVTPPDGNPTCATFDCPVGTTPNASPDSSPCPADPCIHTDCCNGTPTVNPCAGVPDGTGCNDDDETTANDICTAGACGGVAPITPGPTASCTAPQRRGFTDPGPYDVGYNIVPTTIIQGGSATVTGVNCNAGYTETTITGSCPTGGGTYTLSGCDPTGGDPCASVNCPAALSVCKVAGTCQANTGDCAAETDAADNTPCDAGDPRFTGNDVCSAGVCMASVTPTISCVAPTTQGGYNIGGSISPGTIVAVDRSEGVQANLIPVTEVTCNQISGYVPVGTLGIVGGCCGTDDDPSATGIAGPCTGAAEGDPYTLYGCTLPIDATCVGFTGCSADGQSTQPPATNCVTNNCTIADCCTPYTYTVTTETDCDPLPTDVTSNIDSWETRTLAQAEHLCNINSECMGIARGGAGNSRFLLKKNITGTQHRAGRTCYIKD